MAEPDRIPTSCSLTRDEIDRLMSQIAVVQSHLRLVLTLLKNETPRGDR